MVKHLREFGGCSLGIKDRGIGARPPIEPDLLSWMAQPSASLRSSVSASYAAPDQTEFIHNLRISCEERREVRHLKSYLPASAIWMNEDGHCWQCTSRTLSRCVPTSSRRGSSSDASQADPIC